MTEKNYYLDFKWLIEQKQWKAYINFLDDQIDSVMQSFISDSSINLRDLQVQAQTILTIRNSIQKYVDDRETKEA